MASLQFLHFVLFWADWICQDLTKWGRIPTIPCMIRQALRSELGSSLTQCLTFSPKSMYIAPAYIVKVVSGS